MSRNRLVPRRGLAHFVLFAGVFCLASCGGGGVSNRIPLEGKITVPSGKPVNGSISLTPTGPKGIGTTASIVNGDYRFTKDNGPEPGKYRATIVILRSPEKQPEKPTGPAVPSQFRESFDAELDLARPRLDHALKGE